MITDAPLYFHGYWWIYDKYDQRFYTYAIEHNWSMASYLKDLDKTVDEFEKQNELHRLPPR